MKHMKQMMLPLLSLLFLVVLVLGGRPVWADQTTEQSDVAGSFYLAVTISNRPVIEPTLVTYTQGQTIREALRNSGFQFGGIDQFYITDVEGVTGNYMIYYDQGGYDLDQPATAATALLFSEREDAGEGDLAMMKDMYAYLAMENHVQNYAAAEAAYTQCLVGLRTSGSDTEALRAALLAAIKEYESLFEGKKYAVQLEATQGTTVLKKPVFTLKDAYGNEYVTQGTIQSVIAGLYEFTVSDGGMNSVSGSLQVKAAESLKVTLPQGDWFKELNLLDSSRNPYEAQVDLKAGTAAFQIPDTAGKSSVILNAVMASGAPDEEKTLLYAAYVNRSTEKLTSYNKNWDSTSATLSNLVLEDCLDTELTVYGQYTGEDGYIQRQTIQCQVQRVPTLASLTVSADGTKMPLSFDPLVNAYQIPTVTKKVKLTAKAHDSSYTVEGTGSFTLGDTTAECKRTINVTGPNGLQNTYVLQFELKDSVAVTVTPPSGCSVKVYNSADDQIKAVDGVYHLIPKAEYYYITTKQQEYHAKGSFTASEGLQVSAAAPRVEEALTDFCIYNDSNAKSRVKLPVNVGFTSENHEYVYMPLDAYSAAYTQATCASGYTATIYYVSQTTSASTHGLDKSLAITNVVNDTGTAKNVPYLLGKCGYSQTATLRVAQTVDGITYYQDYRLTFNRTLHLSAMELQDSYGTMRLFDAAGNVIDFKRDITDYYLSVDRTTPELVLQGTFMNQLTATPVCGGYYAMLGDVAYEELSDVKLTLDSGLDEELIAIQVCCEAEGSIPTTYNLHVKKTDPVPVTIKTTPEDAVVYMVDVATERRISMTEGYFPLTPGATYEYLVTAKGYVAKQVSDYVAPNAATTLEINLLPATANDLLVDYEAEWPSMRNDEYNNGIVSSKTPITSDDATLYWATSLGEGYSTNGCGCPIMVDGYLYTYAGTSIYKVDSVSGEVVAEGTMDHKSSFAINSPTYAEGMVFVGLADGTVQAFNAATLESLWIYRDPLKGQPNCPIIYKDGYIYTGFWMGETTKANYVCLSVTDEDPYNPLETKVPRWRYKHNGFYWAGAYVSDSYVLIGTDDGSSGYLTGHASILSLNPATGELIDSFTLKEPGDQRSGITFVPDAENKLAGYGYFTTKGGYFYQIRVEADGTFSHNKVKALQLYNYANNASQPAMSTCTPTIYNGRAYIGVSGTGQFGQYSGHNITVIDLEHWTIAYTVRTQGYPQTSGLLTTAYEEENGDVYIYFIDNFTPGKLRVLKDHKGQTKPGYTQVESYTEKGETTDYNVAYNLFTPSGAQAQYAICSPLADSYGTLYFKNDSAYIMAVGCAIEKLEITEEPDQLDYQVGDCFDGTGMKVTAVYSNGARRDVTNYVTWSSEPLTEEDTALTIEFPYTMYHDGEEGAGEDVEHPYATLNLNLTVKKAGEPSFIWTQVTDPETGLEAGYTAQAIWTAAELEAEEDLILDCEVTSELIKEAGCDSKGKLIYTAQVTRNDQTFTGMKNVTLPVLGHDLQQYEAKAATCLEEGWEAYESCSRCDYTTQTVIPALGHDWDEGKIVKEATEEATGVKEYTCGRCGEKYTQVLPKKEHVHVKVNVALVKATWTKSGKTSGVKCSTCGKVLSGCKTIAKAAAPKLSTVTYVYNGKVKKPTVKISNLTAGIDYTVSYKNNKLVGKATVTVKLKGNYTGSKTLTFKIYPVNITLNKLTAVTKGFTATWSKKSAQVTGYQLRYSTSSKMTNPKTVTIKSCKTVSKKVTKLKAKKTYYVQIRTYKTVGKTNYCGSWSKVKSVKTK